jgi:hypothetical protein
VGATARHRAEGTEEPGVTGETEVVQDPEVVRPCLEDAGFDTSHPTGLEAGGKISGVTIEFRDEFTAERDGEVFLLWFVTTEEAATQLADTVNRLLEIARPAPWADPLHRGTVVMARLRTVDPNDLEAVESCLGL